MISISSPLKKKWRSTDLFVPLKIIILVLPRLTINCRRLQKRARASNYLCNLAWDEGRSTALLAKSKMDESLHEKHLGRDVLKMVFEAFSQEGIRICSLCWLRDEGPVVDWNEVLWIAPLSISVGDLNLLLYEKEMMIWEDLLWFVEDHNLGFTPRLSIVKDHKNRPNHLAIYTKPLGMRPSGPHRQWKAR